MAENALLAEDTTGGKGGTAAPGDNGIAGSEPEDVSTAADLEPDWSSAVQYGGHSQQMGFMPNNATHVAYDTESQNEVKMPPDVKVSPWEVILHDSLGGVHGHMPNNSTHNAIETMINGQISHGEIGDQFDKYKPDFEKNADASLDKQMDAAGFTADEKQKAEALQDAVIHGDKKALEAAVAGMSPEQLKKLSGEVQKNLNALHAEVTIKTIGDGGSLFLQQNGASTGLVVGKDGAKPVALKYVDGQPFIDNTLTPTKDSADVAKSISNSATFNAEVLAPFKYGTEVPGHPGQVIVPTDDTSPARPMNGGGGKIEPAIRWR